VPQGLRDAEGPDRSGPPVLLGCRAGFSR
jgi:hypothetical protein